MQKDSIRHQLSFVCFFAPQERAPKTTILTPTRSGGNPDKFCMFMFFVVTEGTIVQRLCVLREAGLARNFAEGSRGNGERGNGSEKFSAPLSTIANKKSYPINL